MIRSFGPPDRFDQLLGSLVLRSNRDVQTIVTGVDQSIHQLLRVCYNEEKRIFSVRSPRAAKRPSMGGPRPPKSAPPRAAQPVKGPARGSHKGPKSAPATKRAHPPSYWSGAVPPPTPFSVWPVSPFVPTGPPRKKPRAAQRLLAPTPKAAPAPTSVPIFLPGRRNLRHDGCGALGGTAAPHGDVFSGPWPTSWMLEPPSQLAFNRRVVRASGWMRVGASHKAKVLQR